MSAPTNFLFDVDFAADGKRAPAEPMMTLAAHEVKLAETETAAHRRGYAEAKAEAETEAERRIADAMERIAAGSPRPIRRCAAIEARLECEAVEVAVAVARKLAPSLIAREPFAEISALATDCFRELRATPHIVVRVNDALYADGAGKARCPGARRRLRRPSGGDGRARHRLGRLPHRVGGRRRQSRRRRRRRRRSATRSRAMSAPGAVPPAPNAVQRRCVQ